MDGETLELETPELEVEQPEVESAELEQPEGAEQQTEETEQQSPSNPYTTQFSREMRAAVRAWAQQNPEAAKFVKPLLDNHARMFALSQLEPKGLDGVREKYALLDGLVRGDVKGAEALTAIQEELAGVEEIDSLIASGDPKAFDLLSDEIVGGLAKLAPAYLDRVKSSDPEAFQAAIMPHVIGTLSGSEAMAEYNRGIDELRWIAADRDLNKLSPEELLRYAAAATKVLSGWSNGLNQMAQKVPQGTQPQQQQADPLAQQRTEFEKQQQEFHWNTKIQPVAAKYETAQFNAILAPYDKRLKLSSEAKADLLEAFRKGMEKAGGADQDYMRQMGLYRKQRNPDPTAVSNFVKNAITKHAKPVLEGIIKARYGAFLAGKPKQAAPVARPGQKPNGPVAPNVEIRSVKPPMSEIDHRNTPVEWLAQKKYRLYSGKIVQVRTA